MNTPLKIHLYALCWNEEKMLPYFFHHYDNIVDQYFIFDNNSTDRSIDIILANKKATIFTINFIGDSFVEGAANFYSSCWQQSKGDADWVIICNIDEFFYHRDGLKNFLLQYQKDDCTIVFPHGYEMVSDDFPNFSDKQIYEIITHGARSLLLDKPQLFNPNKFDQLKFAAGRHSVHAIGDIKYIDGDDSIKLLHYKFLGENYWMPRQKQLGNNLKKRDIKNQWGVQYIVNDEEKKEAFLKLKEDASKII